MKKFWLKITSALFAALILCTGFAGCTGGAQSGGAHKDADGDGICDDCGIKVNVELTFYAVNDLHGKFMDTSSQPGVNELTTYIKTLYADKGSEEILLSSGDMWQGTVESSTNKGKLMTEWMNELGFVSMTLGNHEYDWGEETIAANGKLAEFPFLAINVTKNGKPVDYCRASTVVERSGAKIGIIGAIGDCLGSISGDFTDGLEFATGDDLTLLVQAESKRLREEGCDFIVYSIHDGGTEFGNSIVNSVNKKDIAHYYSTSLSDGYVDLVFEAHTHQSYILKDEYGVYHLQGGGENRGISCAEVSLNLATGKHSVKQPHIVSNSVYASNAVKGDPVTDRIFDKYFPDDNPYTTVLGKNSARRQSDAVCDRVARLYYDRGVKEWGSEYKIALGGGFLKLRSPYRLDAGNVTYSQLFSVLPFDNDLVLGRIKGSDLKSRFLNSTNGDYHIYTTIKANEVSDNTDYYIIVDSYSSTYRYNRITEVKRLKGVYARDLLKEYVAAGGWSK